MARLPRFKVTEEAAWYHLHNRISGCRGEFPLTEQLPRRTFIELTAHYSTAYFCRVAAICIMGNHTHIVAQFEKPKQVTFEELKRRAHHLYPSKRSQREIAFWTAQQWERFRKRLFDVSEFMRNLQSAFARWYNRTYGRRGRFWAGRFKSVCLQEGNAVLDCMLYVDLNPVRAGIVQRPEEWQGSSIYLREIKQDAWLMPLEEVWEEADERLVLEEYRARLYYRGNIPTKPGQAFIPNHIVDDEEKRGFKVRGVYRKRLGYFVDGMVVGSEQFIRSNLVAMSEAGIYKRRKNPIAQLNGIHFSLREQRGTSVVF